MTALGAGAVPARAGKAPGSETAVARTLASAPGSPQSAPIRVETGGAFQPRPTPSPPAELRLPPPSEARAIARPRALAASEPLAFTPALQQTLESGPFRVRLINAGGGSERLVEALAVQLAKRGMHSTATGDTNVDAVIVLSAASQPAVWYCDWPSSGGRALAESLASRLPPTGASGGAHDGLRCDTATRGRARTPVALLALTPGGGGEGISASAPADIAAALAEYFARFGSAQRAARFAARMVWPATGAVTSGFDVSHPLGIDIGQWQGPVAAATGGRVYWAGGDPCCSYGRFVVIDGPDGIRTLYAHLDSIAVKQGQEVGQGQVIGQVGCTGVCEGTHLHFEVFDGGLRQDPLAYLPR